MRLDMLFRSRRRTRCREVHALARRALRGRGVSISWRLGLAGTAIVLLGEGTVHSQNLDSLISAVVPTDSTSNARRRTQWLALRQVTAAGTFEPHVLGRALNRKQRLFGSTPFINTAEPGGCAWLPIGPRNVNGRIRCLAIHPTDGSILYAGAAAGGVWKTMDGGQSWKPTMSTQLSLAIGALAIDPSNPETVYAATGEPVNLADAFGPAGTPGSTAWFYEGEGVLRSTNGGASWVLLGRPNDYHYKIAVDPFNSANVLCAGFSRDGSGGLCKLNADGSWTTIQTGTFTDVVFDPVNTNVAYAAKYNGGIWKFQGGNLTNWSDWHPKNSGLPSAGIMRRIKLAIAPSNPSILYAKVERCGNYCYGEVYRTENAGDSWTVLTDLYVDGDTQWWCSLLAVDPGYPNVVFAGGNQLVRSMDSGQSWEYVEQYADGSNIHVDHHDLAFASSSEFYLANDGGVFKGTTSGSTSVTWSKVSTGLVATQFYDLAVSPATPSMLGGGTQDNGTLISTGGLSWRHVLRGDGAHLLFHPSYPYTAWAQYFASAGPGMVKTTDGWECAPTCLEITTITDLDHVVFPSNPLVLHPTAPDVLFIGTNQVQKSSDGGLNWVTVSPVVGPTPQDVFTEIAIAPSSPDVIYAGTLRGRLFRAAGSPTSFTEITPTVAGFPARWISGIGVHPSDPDIVYVTFLGVNENSDASNHLWRGSRDAIGVWTWEPKNTGLPNVPTGAIVVAAYPTLYLATDIGVYRSLDAGISWAPFELGLPNVPVVDLSLSPDGSKLIAATHGRGMYQIQLVQNCPPVDIYLRDNILDTGEVIPSPSSVPDPTQPGVNVYFYKSADIKVDAVPYDVMDALVDGVEFDAIQHADTPLIEVIQGTQDDAPVRGALNKVRVQVHNRGYDDATAVTVKLAYADASAGLPALPGDFWSNFFGTGYDQTNWKAIGLPQTVSVLEPGVPAVLDWEWSPPADASDHVCLLAMAHCAQDPLLPQTETNVGTLTHFNKRITHKNVQPVGPSLFPYFYLFLYANNPFPIPREFDLRLQEISHACRRVWLVIPHVTMREPLERSIEGFRLVDRTRIQRFVEASKRERLDRRARELLGSRESRILEASGGWPAAALHGLTLQRGQRLGCLVLVELDPTIAGRTHLLDVTQYSEKRLIGGSEIVATGKSKSN